jgi:DNA-directed RNA polymerase I subunit RPA2
LATGNIRSQSGLDLMQQSGFTIIADKLNNMRFLSHFRSVHRGAFFAEMKTTTVRKLLPEQWGFICPVHTPDGGPCGLLNHITMQCKPLTHPDHISAEKIPLLLLALGVTPARTGITFPPSAYVVLLNGRVFGSIEAELTTQLENAFRTFKKDGTIGKTTEFVYIPRSKLQRTPVFPGIFISTEEARLVRPVKHLQLNHVEWISPLEQLTMSIACSEVDVRTDTQYQEIDPVYILSILAANVPYLNYNQSPRNMYQCQMAKQTMGTPCHNYPYRFDNKMYRILFP